nr:Uncharacterised protein [Klebsiella pneumoniae]
MRIPAEAVAIADGKIVATGSHDRIMSFAAEGTQIVDLKGHTVIRASTILTCT